MAEALTAGGASGTGRRHSAGPQALAHAAAAARRHRRAWAAAAGAVAGFAGAAVARVQPGVDHRVPRSRCSRSSRRWSPLWFIRPMRRRATDLQVALYVEEHEPSLQAAILSAVDAGATAGRRPPGGVPPVDRRADGRAGGREVPRDRRRCAASAARRCGATPWCSAALAAVGRAAARVGPEFFRQGASALLVLSRERPGGQSLRHQRDAGRRDRPEGIRSDLRAQAGRASARTTSP